MKHKIKNFKFSLNKKISVDRFLEKVMYQPKVGYYNNRVPFGKNGDFVTAPTISNLFSEILAIWIISAWEKLEQPKIFNLVELGPGDGSLAKILIQTFKKFPKFNKSVNLYLYEKSNLLKKIQKKKLKIKKLNGLKIITQSRKDQYFFLVMNFLMQFQ